jgi:hypothetical protein
MSWNEIFSAIAPCMIQEASDYSMREALRDALIRRLDIKLRERYHLEVESGDFHNGVVQLRALGLITPSAERRSVKDRGIAYWSLTPYGDNYMNRLVAIRRQHKNE